MGCLLPHLGFQASLKHPFFFFLKVLPTSLFRYANVAACYCFNLLFQVCRSLSTTKTYF